MKIGIVLHPYDEDKPAGLARTIYEWTKALLETDTENSYVIFVKKKPRKQPEFSGSHWKLEELGGGMLWLDNLKNKTPCDVYLFNTPVLPLFFRPKKSVVLALDFAYYYLAPKTIKGQMVKWITFIYHGLSLKRADKVVAISQATKEDTIKLFGTPEEKIDVSYLGFKKICESQEISVEAPTPFFFFAGIIKERKNVFNIVKGFEHFSKEQEGYYLLIGGNPSGVYYETLKKYIEKHDLEENIIFLGHLNDGQLSYLYKRALAFVFPTLIEGFGMPVVEAMDCGVPVITSNVSSLKEVGANGSALLVDPYDPEAIARAMGQVARDQNLRGSLIKKGALQVKNFSWEKAAREMLVVLNEVHTK
ncbi:hypothetical protein CL654_02920 [bacterium]|nr:hypothetical protein [bacterium]